MMELTGTCLVMFVDTNNGATHCIEKQHELNLNYLATFRA